MFALLSNMWCTCIEVCINKFLMNKNSCKKKVIRYKSLLCTVTKPRPQKRSVPADKPVAVTIGLGITTKSVRQLTPLTAPTAVPSTVLSAPSTSPVTVNENAFAA